VPEKARAAVTASSRLEIKEEFFLLGNTDLYLKIQKIISFERKRGREMQESFQVSKLSNIEYV